MSNRKIFFLIASIALLAVAAFVVIPTAYANGCMEDFDLEDCAPVGDPEIDVTEDVTNSLDSGVGGNWWAYIDYERSIRAFEENSLFVIVQYDGEFTSVEGPSPQNTGTVGAGVTGTMTGGYLARVHGELLGEPTWPTEGYVGLHDHAATWTDTDDDGIFDIGEEDLPGYVNWLDQYFEEWILRYIWWGWQYTPLCEGNGFWINSQDGNEGDITGEPDLSCLPPPPTTGPTPLVMMYVYHSETGFYGDEGPGATNTLTIYSAQGEPTVPIREYWAGGSLPEDYELGCYAMLWDDESGGLFACDDFLKSVGERRALLRNDPEGLNLLPKIENYLDQLEELGL